VTMRALASEAGVAQATLYNIYGSKDDLILAALNDLLVGIDAQLQAMDPRPGIDRILGLAQITGAQIQQAPKYTEAMARALAGARAGDPLVDVLYIRTLPFLVENLQIAKDQGEIGAQVDIDLVARHLVGQAWGVVWLWIMGTVPLEAIVSERLRSDLMTLVGVTTGAARKRIERQLKALDARSTN